jgi:tetratricopeptide (TPR) repeat protein
MTIGRVFFAQGKTDLAIGEYQRAIDIAPEYAQAHYYLGLAWMKNSRLDAAATAFKEVIRIAPDTEIGFKSAGYIDLLK